MTSPQPEDKQPDASRAERTNKFVAALRRGRTGGKEPAASEQPKANPAQPKAQPGSPPKAGAPHMPEPKGEAPRASAGGAAPAMPERKPTASPSAAGPSPSAGASTPSASPAGPRSAGPAAATAVVPPPAAPAKAAASPEERKPSAAPPPKEGSGKAAKQEAPPSGPAAHPPMQAARPATPPGTAQPTAGTDPRASAPPSPTPAPTRRADGHEREMGASKAASSSPVRTITAQDAGAAIHAAAARDAVTPHAKLPEFPPPVGERPEELKKEEARRARIRAKEEAWRAKETERLTAEGEESTLRRLRLQWEAEDNLEYRTDPDDEEIEVYPVNPPYGYVQMIFNRRTHEKLYHVIEPKLTREERLVLEFIETTLVDVLDLKPEELEKDDLPDYIKKKFDQVVEDYSIRLGDEDSPPEESRARLLYYVLRDFIGEGPIDVFVRDPMLEDISCDGPHQPLFIYHRKYESVTTTVRFRDHAHLDSFVIRMAQRAGKHVSIAEPILDATMRDGSRLQATLAKEVSTFGSTFTIRKFRDVPFSPIDLVRFGTMSSQMLAYLWMVIANRQSGIYAGGTASGKTTAINAIMLFIPPGLKIITIEDTREINIPQPNWIAGLTRGGFGPRDSHGRQAGEIDMFQLLKNALRQRPEYIIVGEVRGAEAYNLFQAMATGHAAYGTMHADSVDAVIHRLESDPINIPRSLLEALDVVAVQIQTRVGGKRVRRTKQITEIVGLDPNTHEILTNEVFRWEPSTDQFPFSGVSYSLERIAVESGMNLPDVLAEMDDRRKVIEWMVEQEIRKYTTVAHIINVYFHDKEKIMVRVREGLPWQE